jgi:hypothetical protein
VDTDATPNCPKLPTVGYQEILRELTDAELRYLERRLAVRSDAEACKLVGISRTLISHSPRLLLIREAILQARMDGVELTRERLRRLAGNAVQVLEDVMASPTAETASRVAASKTVLDRIGLPAQQDVQVSAQGETMRGLVQAIRASLPPVVDDGDCDTDTDA